MVRSGLSFHLGSASGQSRTFWTARDSDPAEREEGEGSEDGEVLEDDNAKFRKAIEDGLRDWLEAEDCRTLVIDRYFCNPTQQLGQSDAPTACCDKCMARQSHGSQFGERTSDDPPEESQEAGLTANTRKRRNRGFGTRKKEQLKRARDLLEEWRLHTWKQRYLHSCFGPETVVPNRVLSSGWEFANDHATEALQILETLDGSHQRAKDLAAQEKARERQQKALEKAREDEMVKILKAQQKEHDRQWKQLVADIEKNHQAMWVAWRKDMRRSGKRSAMNTQSANPDPSQLTPPPPIPFPPRPVICRCRSDSSELISF